MMSLHLAEISKQVAPGAHAVLVLDGAGYHGTAKTRRPPGLVVPDTITLLHLPASSPELNPMELVWQYLRQSKLANRVFRTYQQIVDCLLRRLELLRQRHRPRHFHHLAGVGTGQNLGPLV